MIKPFDPFNQCTEYYYRIEKLLADNTALKAENESLRKDMLAAEQLNNKRLRDALQAYIDEHEECQDADDWMAMMCSMEAHHAADEALSQPADTSALDAYVAEKVKACRELDEKQIAYLFEERNTLTRQRDLAIDVLKTAYEVATNHDDRLPFDWAVYCEMLWQAIKESEVKE